MTDPIVDEVRCTRARLLEECENDLHELMRRHRTLAAVEGARSVSLEEFRRRYGRQRPRFLRPNQES
jgi:hypothetical protein